MILLDQNVNLIEYSISIIACPSYQFLRTFILGIIWVEVFQEAGMTKPEMQQWFWVIGLIGITFYSLCIGNKYFCHKMLKGEFARSKVNWQSFMSKTSIYQVVIRVNSSVVRSFLGKNESQLKKIKTKQKLSSSHQADHSSDS